MYRVYAWRCCFSVFEFIQTMHASNGQGDILFRDSIHFLIVFFSLQFTSVNPLAVYRLSCGFLFYQFVVFNNSLISETENRDRDDHLFAFRKVSLVSVLSVFAIFIEDTWAEWKNLFRQKKKNDKFRKNRNTPVRREKSG